MTKKIKQATVVDQPNENFAMFTIGIEFEDGEKGACYAKTADRWKAGDEVTAVIQGQMKGGNAKGMNKYKLEKPQGAGGYSGGSTGGFKKSGYTRPTPESEKAKSDNILASVALKGAIDLVQAGQPISNLENLAKGLVDLHRKVEDYIKQPARPPAPQHTTPPPQVEEDDDIPMFG